MKEKKITDIIDDTDNKKQKHLDFGKISFPDSDVNYQDEIHIPINFIDPISKSGDNVIQYDPNKVNQIKNFNEYSEKEQDELRLWTSEGYDTSIFDDAKNIPMLERLYLFRFLQFEGFNLTDYVKYQNDYDDLELFQMILYNFYSKDTDPSNNLENSRLYIPENDYQDFIKNIPYRLVLAGYSSPDYNLYQKMIKQGFFIKDKFTDCQKQQIILAELNGVDLIAKINELSEMLSDDSFDKSNLDFKKVRLTLEKKSSVPADQRNKNFQEVLKKIYDSIPINITPIEKFDLVPKMSETDDSFDDNDITSNEDDSMSESNEDNSEESFNQDESKESVPSNESNKEISLGLQTEDESKFIDFANKKLSPEDFINELDNLINYIQIIKEKFIKSIK